MARKTQKTAKQIRTDWSWDWVNVKYSFTIGEGYRIRWDMRELAVEYAEARGWKLGHYTLDPK